MPLNEGAINQILPFAAEGVVDAGDVLTLAEYKTHAMRLRGHQAGMALRELQNTATRQSTHMATGVAQFIANRYAPGVVDDGNLDKVEAGLVAAIIDVVSKIDLSAAFLKYFLGWYVFSGGMHPDPLTGMEPVDGSWIDDADVIYPLAWAFLQTARGQQMCVTADVYEAMNTAVTYTYPDGRVERWNGVGGVPRYCLDLVNRRLRVPDLRGMYIEGAGFDLLDVGGTHGDMIRNIAGNFKVAGINGGIDATAGAFYGESGYGQMQQSSAANGQYGRFSAARVVPTGNKAAPRAWGALPCVYLGQPAA